MHQPTCQTISIHAPTRGATGVTRVKNYGSKFQSTLPREERLQALPLSDRLCHFNPRSHERSDTARQPGGYLCIISIHAPTRGATRLAVRVHILLEFQSTLPREERRVNLFIISLYPANFNPRSHERSDLVDGVTGSDRYISIHAPTRGATTSVEALSVSMGISIHAPTRGATLSLRISNHSLSISIHAPTRGATSGRKGIGLMDMISIHAPTRGATQLNDEHQTK